MSRFVQKLMASPLGALRLVASDEALVAVYFDARHSRPALAGEDVEAHEVLGQAALQLDEYFAGQRQHFSVPFATTGTAFQQTVWEALRTIPFGEHRSYAWLAREIGNPKASRAVGAANGRNPISIIVPCHRVIGASGDLTGYGGGIETKRWLLDYEQSVLATLRAMACGQGPPAPSP